eukprot:TRINITY_DN1949_c0_g3_i2.p1 TRINITY_DN1949_c0_g3~~TRINITY_DN1949_c0_g3_i2.p1  ORF type:complete len:1683 (-),score=671.18 TRINITY_DN1949_c0_g3_i2:114-5162(-)
MFGMLKRGMDLFSSSPTRLLRFALNNVLRPYLKKTIEQDRFELGLWDGKVNIEGFELNEQMLNMKLNGVLPFEVGSAFIGRLSIDIPWRKVSTESVQVTLQDATFHLSLLKDSDLSNLHVSVEECIKSSLTSSIRMNQERREKEEEEDGNEGISSEEYEENLGIESLEQLFESIFSKMQITLSNTTVYIERSGEESICINIGRIDFSNATEKQSVPSQSSMNENDKFLKKSIKKARINEIKVEIESSKNPWIKGKIFSISEENEIELQYEKNDREEFTSMFVKIFLSHGVVNATLSKSQISFLNSFLTDFSSSQSNLQEEQADLYASSRSVRFDLKASTGGLSNSNISLESLERSIVNMAMSSSVSSFGASSKLASSFFGAPNASSKENLSNSIMKLKTELIIQNIECKFLPSDPMKRDSMEESSSAFSLFIEQFVFQSSNPHLSKSSSSVKIGNIRLYEQVDSESPKKCFFTLVPEGSKIKKSIELSITLKMNDGQQMYDIVCSLPIINLPWDFSPFQRMSQVFSLISKETTNDPIVQFQQQKTNQNPKKITIIQLKCQEVILFINLPEHLGKNVGQIWIELVRLNVNNRPSKSGASIVHLECQSLDTKLLFKREDGPPMKKDLFKARSMDAMGDRPRLDIRIQNPISFGEKIKLIPSSIIDMENTFSPPFFSYYNEECTRIATLNSKGIVDLDRTKQSSNFIMDLVLPRVELTIDKSDLELFSRLASALEGGESKPSSIILSIGKANLNFVDNLYVPKSRFGPKSLRFPLEIEGLSLFQGVISGSKKETGTFLYVNAYDIKLLDDENGVLARKTPKQMRMDESYCAPFAISATKLVTLLFGHQLTFERLTLGTRLSSWKRFISFFDPLKGNEEEGKEAKNEADSSFPFDLQLYGASIYYQPTSNLAHGRDNHSVMYSRPSMQTFYVIPPRAILSVQYLRFVVHTIPSNPSVLHLNAKGLNLWLKEDFHHLGNNEVWLDLCHPLLETHLSSKCLIPIINVQTVDILSQTRDNVNEITVTLQPSDGTETFVSIKLSADSLETFNRILRSLPLDIASELSSDGEQEVLGSKLEIPSSPSLPFEPPLKKSPTKEEARENQLNRSQQQPQPRRDPSSAQKKELRFEDSHTSSSSKNQPHHHPNPQRKSSSDEIKRKTSMKKTEEKPKAKNPLILFDEDEDFEPPKLSRSQPQPIPHHNINEDYSNNNNNGKKRAGSMEESESWGWIEEEAKVIVPPIEEIFPNDKKRERIVKVIGLKIKFDIKGGRDWSNGDSFEPIEREENKAISNPQDWVQVHLDISRINVEFFEEGSEGDTRISTEIKSLTIDDHVTKSHMAKLLTFSRFDKDIVKSSSFGNGNSSPSPIGNVISIIFEKGKYEGKSFESYKLRVEVMPIRLYVDLDTSSFLYDFFQYTLNSLPSAAPGNKRTQPDECLFEYFELSELDMVIDYKPKTTIGSVYSDIKLGNQVWAIKAVELMKAPITLSSVVLYKVKNTDQLVEEILNNYLKSQGEHIFNYLWGTRIGQPVQICLNIGTAVVDLIKTPVEEYQRGGNVLKGIGLGATSLVSTLTLELLNVGASSAITAKKGLTKIDRVLTGRSPDYHISNYASQPGNFTEGASLAGTNIVNSFSNSFNALVNGGITQLPHAIIQPVIGGLGALSNLTLGLRNTIDPSEYETAKEKYKEKRRE